MKEIDLQIDEFMLNCQAKGLSKKTMASYEQTLRLFSQYFLDNYSIEDANKMNKEMITKYIQYLQVRGKYTVVSNDMSKIYNNPEVRSDLGKKITTTTINNYIRNIKVFFSYLKEYRIIKSNPMLDIKQLKNVRKKQDFISDEDFIRLLKNIDTTKFHGYRDFIIIEMIIDTGMRIGECLLVGINHLDLIKRCILLVSENTKSNKDRYVYFSQTMQQELRRWLQYKDRYATSDYLFCTKSGNPLSISDFESNFKKYAKGIGLDDAHPHQLRNNFAKRFLMAGGDIYTLSRILGHSSVTVTEKAYLDLEDEDIRKQYQRFSPLMNLKKKK
jgi:integrase/recombinase XerD